MSNRYETNFFHINVDGDVNFPISEMNEHDYGIFLHEYIHYIQHLTTIFGIRRCSIFNQLYGNMIIKLLSLEEIHIPIDIVDMMNGNVAVEKLFSSKNNGYFSRVQGSKYFNGGNIRRVCIQRSEIKKAQINKCAVNIDVYVEEKERPILDELKFGYWCIIESMAHLIQSKVDNDVNHNIVPYCIVEYICKSYCPQFLDNKEMLISICICSLLYANPGVAFFEVVNEVISRKLDNGYTLYKVILRDKRIQYNGKNDTIPEFICDSLDEMLDNVRAAVGDDLLEYSRIIKNCEIEITRKENALLDVLYNGDIKTDEGFNRLFQVYGIPFITANNMFYPQDKSILKDISKILGLELLYKRLTIKQEENKDKDSLCPWYDICNMNYYSDNCKITLDCQVKQWEKSEDCLFVEILKYYGLKDKKIIQDV